MADEQINDESIEQPDDTSNVQVDDSSDPELDQSIDQNDLTPTATNHVKDIIVANQHKDPAETLNAIQDAANKHHNYANLLRGFQQMLQGASRGNFKADNSVADAMDKDANNNFNQGLDIEKFQAKQEQQKPFMELAKAKLAQANITLEDTKRGDDLNSPVTKATQSIAKLYYQMMNKPYDESLDKETGNQILKQIPDLKYVAVEYMKDHMAARKEQNAMGIAKLGSDTKKEVAADTNQTKIDVQDIKNKQQQDVYKSKIDQDVKKQLEQMRGNPAVQQAEKDLYAASKADELVKEYGNPNDMPDGKVRLLLSELGKIATGGVPTTHELEGLQPGTLTGYMKKQYGKFINEPTGANAAAFINDYAKYIHGVSSNARNLVTDRYGRILNVNKRVMSPEAYTDAEENYLNRFNPKKTENRETQSTSESVRMIDPKGNIRLVPADQVEAAKAAGGQVAQ